MFADKWNILYTWIILATVHASNHICNTPSHCILETIQCIDDEPCLIECSANYACKESTIICPKNDICNVQCIGNEEEKQCEKINITATHSTTLILNVSSSTDSSKTMRDSDIYCPYNHDGINKAPNCLLHCNQDDLMKKTVIYAVNGFNDIAFTSTDLCYTNGQIQCNRNYTETCLITNEQPFQCEDELSSCQAITYYPTYNPTYYPTDQPTYNPTDQPTLYPTININLTISTLDINNEYSTTFEIKIMGSFVSWYNNTFMTIIVMAAICSLSILMAICIACYKRIIQIKDEQSDIAFPDDQGMDRHDSFQYNEKLQLNWNKKNIHMNGGKTQIKEHLGEYDIVLSFPDSDYD